MGFIVVWVHESGIRFYLEEIKISRDGTALKWCKQTEKANLFHSSESILLDKIMSLYFEGKYYYEYFGGFEK